MVSVLPTPAHKEIEIGCFMRMLVKTFSFLQLTSHSVIMVILSEKGLECNKKLVYMVS